MMASEEKCVECGADIKGKYSKPFIDGRVCIKCHREMKNDNN